jgi:hypothetical protein
VRFCFLVLNIYCFKHHNVVDKRSARLLRCLFLTGGTISEKVFIHCFHGSSLRVSIYYSNVPVRIWNEIPIYGKFLTVFAGRTRTAMCSLNWHNGLISGIKYANHLKPWVWGVVTLVLNDVQGTLDTVSSLALTIVYSVHDQCHAAGLVHQYLGANLVGEVSSKSSQDFYNLFEILSCLVYRAFQEMSL